MRRILIVIHQGAARDAAGIHFRPSIKRTDRLVFCFTCWCWCIVSVQVLCWHFSAKSPDLGAVSRNIISFNIQLRVYYVTVTAQQTLTKNVFEAKARYLRVWIPLRPKFSRSMKCWLWGNKLTKSEIQLCCKRQCALCTLVPILEKTFGHLITICFDQLWPSAVSTQKIYIECQKI